VASGLVDTDLTSPDLAELAETGVPMGRRAKPREVAEAGPPADVTGGWLPADWHDGLCVRRR
jgi:hypothetical protein